MKQMTTDEVKAVQIAILSYVADFCDQNGIRYWIDCGTLLGAVRHKGYIPWDDDIDVGMLREDYDRFSALFHDPNGQYRFLCVENTPDFYVPHGKVCDNTTVLYEPDENGFKSTVNIDIFIYDNAPEDDREVERMFDRRDKLRHRFSILYSGSIHRGSRLKRILKRPRYGLFKVLYGKEPLIPEMVEIAKKYAAATTSRVGNFTDTGRMVCDKRVLKDFTLVEFEGKPFKAPIGYDEWLTAFYGDYMTLPPVEQRVSHHAYKAFFKE